MSLRSSSRPSLSAISADPPPDEIVDETAATGMKGTPSSGSLFIAWHFVEVGATG